MPELPDVLCYVNALQPRVVGRVLHRARIASPFLLRTFEPEVDAAVGRPVTGVERIGKRIVLGMEGDLLLVFHLMIAGRFRWSSKPDVKPPGKVGLAAFSFGETGSLLLIEASQKKRASLHVIDGREGLQQFERGGIDPMGCDRDAFTEALHRENHTLKRSLTDPRLFDGIGNAYSDEILHAAQLSPFKMSTKLTDAEAVRLYDATTAVLTRFIDLLQTRFAQRFPGPGDITAFRPEFAAHGRFNEPCPVCNTPIQRIRYADNETNYCPTCQTDGKILADRSLSRLLRDDWPRSVEELE